MPGVAGEQSRRATDLLVTVEVEVPGDLDEAGQAAVAAYREARGGHDPRASLQQGRA